MCGCVWECVLEECVWWEEQQVFGKGVVVVVVVVGVCVLWKRVWRESPI